jgi:hypothetical protein
VEPFRRFWAIYGRAGGYKNVWTVAGEEVERLLKAAASGERGGAADLRRAAATEP